jgi:hypothetical protein
VRDTGLRTLVYLCDWLPPDFGAVGQYALQYAKQRASDGHKVVLVGLSTSASAVHEEAIGSGKLKIIKLQTSTYNRVSVRDRAWWTLKTNVRLFLRALPEIRRCRELMFTGSPPFLLHVVAPFNLLLRRKLTYRITDFFPECLIAELGRTPWYLAALQRLTLFWRRRLDLIEVLSEDQRRRLLEAGMRPERIVIRRDTSPAPITSGTSPLSRPAVLAGKKVLLYSGNFGVAHEHETFLSGYRKHHREGSGRVVLWLNAQGARADALEKALQEDGLPVHRTRPVPLEQLARLLVTPDAHLITLRDAFVGYVLPSKVYGCIDSGKAIVYVGSKGSDIHRLCSAKSTPGWYKQINVGDVDGVFQALEDLAVN